MITIILLLLLVVIPALLRGYVGFFPPLYIKLQTIPDLSYGGAVTITFAPGVQILQPIKMITLKSEKPTTVLPNSSYALIMCIASCGV